MKTFTRISILFLMVLALLALPGSVLAQDGGDGKVVFGGTYRLESGQTLNGSLAVFGGEATVEENARVNGDVALSGGTLTVRGEINGNIVVLGGTIFLEDGAVVHGDVNTVGGTINRTPGAQIDGNIVDGPRSVNIDIPRRFNLPFSMNPFQPLGQLASNLFSALVLAGIAMLVALFLPRPTERVTQTLVTQPVVSGAMGALTAIVFPPLMVILALTILLIPVSLLGIVLLVAALVFGWVAAGYEVGRRMASAFRQEWAMPVAAGAGSFTLGVVAAFAGIIPCLNVVVWVLVSLLGLGAVVMSFFGTRVYTPAGRPPAPPAEPASPEAPLPPTSPASPAAPVEPSAGFTFGPGLGAQAFPAESEIPPAEGPVDTLAGILPPEPAAGSSYTLTEELADGEGEAPTESGQAETETQPSAGDSFTPAEKSQAEMPPEVPSPAEPPAPPEPAAGDSLSSAGDNPPADQPKAD